MASVLLKNGTKWDEHKGNDIKHCYRAVKQPHFLSQASRFFSLSLDGEPPQNIIGWTKNDENENGCLFQKKTLCFYTT